MQILLQDIRYGVRMLVHKPGVTVLAVIALALGIGASTAIFSVVNTVLLRSLPYANANRLVMIWEQNRPRARDRNVISPANFQDWREQNNVFEQMAAFYGSTYNLTGLADPQEGTATATATSLFDVRARHPILVATFPPSYAVS